METKQEPCSCHEQHDKAESGSKLWGELWPEIKKENALRRRYYIEIQLASAFKKGDLRKLNRWLKNKDKLDIALGNHGKEIVILNRTRINGTVRSRELFGHAQTTESGGLEE